MSDDQHLTTWIGRLKEGDMDAAQVLWEAYFEKLLRLARRRLDNLPRRVYDEEDVVLSAFNSFYDGVANNRFPKLEDSDDLWKLLVTITARKVHAQRRRQFAAKRGRGRTRGESVFQPACDHDEHVGIGQVIGEEPTPEFAASVSEMLDKLMEELGDRRLQDIAVKKMEGYTNEEIAEVLHCATRTVERKMQRIRVAWEQLDAKMPTE